MRRVRTVCQPRSRALCRPRGVSALETLLALPVLVLLVGGVYEYIRLEQTETAVQHAALIAARSGATGRASGEALDAGLARGLAPLFGGEAKQRNGGSLADRAEATAAEAIDKRFAEVVVLNPTRERFDSLKVSRGPGYEGVPYIPNAGLQRMKMNTAKATGTQTYQETFEETRYRSSIKVDEFIEWLHGNGRRVGILNWGRKPPTLSGTQPGYDPADETDPELISEVDDDGPCGVGDPKSCYNNENNHSHRIDASDLEQIARANWPGGTMDVKGVTSVIDEMRSKADEIVQSTDFCRGAKDTKGNCLGDEYTDQDGPGDYRQAWFDYLDAMKDELDGMGVPYTKTITQTKTYEGHAQKARGNVQDANILKVLVIYGYEPVVPLPWLDSLYGDVGLDTSEQLQTFGAKLYNEHHFQGEATPVSSGCYDFDAYRNALGMPNDDLSSVEANPGYEITLYQHAGFRGWERTLDSDTDLSGQYDDNASTLCVQHTGDAEGAQDPDYAERINTQWQQRFGDGSGGDDTGFGRIRRAAAKIRANGRIPIMETATVRMQSPVEKSPRMLSVSADYFQNSTSAPGDATRSASSDDGPDDFDNPDADDTSSDSYKYSRADCVIADMALRGVDQDTIYDEDSFSHEIIDSGLGDGAGALPGLVDRGLWQMDQDDRYAKIRELQSVCQQYNEKNTDFDYSNSEWYDQLSDDRQDRMDQGQLEPGDWYLPPEPPPVRLNDESKDTWDDNRDHSWHKNITGDMIPSGDQVCWDFDELDGAQDNDLTSIEVADGYTADLWDHPSDNEATIYEDDGQTGDSQTFTGCVDTSSNMEIDNDTASSVSVPEGHELVVYQHAKTDSSDGWKRTIKGPASTDLEGKYNDNLSRACLNKAGSNWHMLTGEGNDINDLGSSSNDGEDQSASRICVNRK